MVFAVVTGKEVGNFRFSVNFVHLVAESLAWTLKAMAKLFVIETSVVNQF